MKDEPNAEAGLYPFEGCCEHSFRVHSSKACQITGCMCKRRRQLPKVELPGLVEHLQADGWKVTHETLRSASGMTMVMTQVLRPDGTVLSETVWVP